MHVNVPSRDRGAVLGVVRVGVRVGVGVAGWRWWWRGRVARGADRHIGVDGLRALALGGDLLHDLHGQVRDASVLPSPRHTYVGAAAHLAAPAAAASASAAAAADVGSGRLSSACLLLPLTAPVVKLEDVVVVGGGGGCGG